MESEWLYSREHNEVCRVIERQELWGESSCKVHFPSDDRIVLVNSAKLVPLSEASGWSKDGLVYLATAARVADSLNHDVLLAPIESAVIPLPHQIKTLSRAMSGEQLRYLLADEVGLGKTIEAGLIMRELKLRGLVDRVLVVAPKGLTAQWMAEMQVHFGEKFRVVLSEDMKTLRRISEGSRFGGDGNAAENAPSLGSSQNDLSNLWKMFPQVIVSMDSVKPIEKRQGWSADAVAEHNRERFEDLISAGWDMVIVDEAHRVSGSTEQVARYRLGKGLSEAAPYMLMLSATPHQGKSEAFRRLMSLIDETAFPDDESIDAERVAPYVIRTEKRHAIDADGNTLFQNRQTRLVPVAWQDRHREQKALYDAITSYVREGYNQAVQEKRNYIGFLMILMQRLVTSSIRAIRTALENRLEVLEEPEGQLDFFARIDSDEWSDLDSQEQLEHMAGQHFKAMRNEREEVRVLLESARRIEQRGPDAKAEVLLDLLYELQREEGEPDLKLLVFTEFVPTQRMIAEFLEERGFVVARINGSMSIEERLHAQRKFADEARIMVSTSAGGEGLNLQFCHVVVNYDMPWNPMLLEQRIGRVDRIGQNKTVKAINLVNEDTVEYRVREVLEEKLTLIYREFGIDKTGDVLDSTQSCRIFDELYIDTIMDPEDIDDKVEDAVDKVRSQARSQAESASVLGESAELDASRAKAIMDHPMQAWLERMTVSYLDSHGGAATRKQNGWELRWADGEVEKPIVFSSRDARSHPESIHLSLETSRIRNLAMRLPRFVPAQSIPAVRMESLPGSIRGVWSLWKIILSAENKNRQRYLSVFRQDDGTALRPTAQRVWDDVMSAGFKLEADSARSLDDTELDDLRAIAIKEGEDIFKDFVRQHRARLEREEQNALHSFAVRRNLINRIGLPEVRNYRLSRLDQEEREWRVEFDRRGEINPEVVPVLVIFVRGGGGDG